MTRQVAPHCSDDASNLFLPGLSLPADRVPEPIDQLWFQNAAEWVAARRYLDPQGISDNCFVRGDPS